jgi:pimeloyl-ACP methyl ester carboxylesterase
MSDGREREALAGIPLRHGRATVNGVELHYVEAGPPHGEAVLLLHGFPEYWAAWRQQIPALAAAGYRVVAPDQRGYNLSAKPAGVAAYDLDVLAADVLALADHLGLGHLRLVGHDWGASVAWWIATTHPERLERLAVLNAGHPALWRRGMRRDPAQRRKSWYVYVMALPWLPEAIMRAGDYRALAQSLIDSSRPGTFSDEDLARYRGAWSQPGALTATINWYRALLRKRMPASLPPVAVQTLLIWGLDDRFGEPAIAEASLQLCSRGRADYVAGATHWIQHEEPRRVNDALLAFLAA